MAFTKKILLFLLVAMPFSLFAAKLREVAVLDIPGPPGFETLAFAKGFLVIAHDGASTVEIYDPTKRRLVAEISNIVSPRGVVSDDATGKVYIADAGANVIDVVNSNNWQVEDQIRLTNAPGNLLLIPGTTNLVASNPYARSLTLVSRQINREMQVIDIAGRPGSMVFDPIRNAVLVSLEDQNEVVSYPASLEANSKPLHAIRLNASEPTSIILNPTARALFISVRFAVLSVDADSGKELSRVPVAGGTDRLWLDSQDQVLYAAASDGTVTSIKVNGRQLAYDSELKTDVKGHTLAFDPTHKLIYVPGGREGKSKMVILKQSGAIPILEEVRTAEVTKSH